MTVVTLIYGETDQLIYVMPVMLLILAVIVVVGSNNTGTDEESGDDGGGDNCLFHKYQGGNPTTIY